jgi:hypothetical protein
MSVVERAAVERDADEVMSVVERAAVPVEGLAIRRVEHRVLEVLIRQELLGDNQKKRTKKNP